MLEAICVVLYKVFPTVILGSSYFFPHGHFSASIVCVTSEHFQLPFFNLLLSMWVLGSNFRLLTLLPSVNEVFLLVCPVSQENLRSGILGSKDMEVVKLYLSA